VKKLLLCLQCYENDKPTAMRLARIIADLESKKTKLADFLFVWRWDTKPDLETVSYISQKFENVNTLITKRQSKGWPSAPNDMFHEGYDHFCLRVRQKIWNYDAAFFFESDCVPLAEDWISQLRNEWYEKDQDILGFIYGPSDHPYPHVNGNLLISPKFQKKCPQFFASKANVGWDVFHAKQMLRHARASRLIYNDYSRPSISCEELFSNKTYKADHPLKGQTVLPCFYHGVKGLSAQDCVRNKFNLT
jgi:hypothetical protein